MIDAQELTVLLRAELERMRLLHLALLDACLRIGSDWTLPPGMGGYRLQVLRLAHAMMAVLEPGPTRGPTLGG